MARARNIKPGFFKNEDLAECSPWARLCFIGLWTLADREGRLEDRPKRIKGELFPYESFDAEPLLQELACYGFIERYEVDGARIIAIPKFADHQTPHIKEKASELPEKQGASTGLKRDADTQNNAVVPSYTEEIQDKSETSPGQAPDKHGASTVQEPDKPRKGSCQHPLNPESLNLNPDSLNPESTGVPPVVGGAQVRTSPATAPPVDNFSEPQGLATAGEAEPEKSAAACEPERTAATAKPDKPQQADRAKSASKTRRGTCLPDGWQLPKSWGEWALTERPDLTEADVRREAAQFADYWHAKAGGDARKADWEATWRNWIRKGEEFRRQKNRNLPAARASPVASAPNADAQWIRPQSEQAFDAAYEKLFGVTIDAAV